MNAKIGKFLQRVFEDGYVYRRNEDVELVDEAVDAGLLRRGDVIGFEYASQAAFVLSSSGLLELNLWEKSKK